MYIDITNLNKQEFLVQLTLHGLEQLSGKGMERVVQCYLLKEALKHHGKPLSSNGFLRYLPADMAVWVDVRSNNFYAGYYDRIFGRGAAEAITRDVRKAQRENEKKERRWWRRFTRSRASTSSTAQTATEEHATPGEVSPTQRRYRSGCAAKISRGARSSSVEILPYNTDPLFSSRKQLLHHLNLAMWEAEGLPDIQAGIDYCIGMAMQAPEPSTSGGTEAGGSVGGSEGASTSGATSTRGSGTSGGTEAGGSVEGGQSSTSLEHASSSHGRHTGHQH